MIDQIISQVKENLSGQLKDKENLNQDQVNKSFEAAKDSFQDEIKQKATSGNFDNITNLFNGNSGDSSSLISGITGTLVPKLTSILGITEGKASSVANMIVPAIVKYFSSKESGIASSHSDLLSKMGLDKGGIAHAAKGLFG